MTMTLRVVQDLTSFLRLQNEWNSLLSESDGNTIFLTWEWLYEWWNTYAPRQRLWVLTARESSGRLLGIAPLYLSRVWLLGCLPVKVVRFIGDHSGDSEYLDFIAARNVGTEVRQHFLAYLSEQQHLWDVFVLRGTPATSPTALLAREWVLKKSYLVREQTFPCSVVELPESWDAYLQVLHAKFRWTIRSRLRRLNEEHKVELVRCENVSSLQACLETFFDLHGRRWAIEYEEGAFHVLRRQFYQRIGTRFLETGWLRFYFLKVDGRFVAAEFDFEYGGKVYCLQKGFDPSCGQDSYGTVLQASVLQDLISGGVAAYDLLRDDLHYKNRWNPRSRTCFTFEIGRRNVRGRFFIYGPVLKRRILNWLKAISPEWLVAFKRRAFERGRRKLYLLKNRPWFRIIAKDE